METASEWGTDIGTQIRSREREYCRRIYLWTRESIVLMCLMCLFAWALIFEFKFSKRDNFELL